MLAWYFILQNCFVSWMGKKHRQESNSWNYSGELSVRPVCCIKKKRRGSKTQQSSGLFFCHLFSKQFLCSLRIASDLTQGFWYWNFGRTFRFLQLGRAGGRKKKTKQQHNTFIIIPTLEIICSVTLDKAVFMLSNIIVTPSIFWSFKIFYKSLLPPHLVSCLKKIGPESISYMLSFWHQPSERALKYLSIYR